MWDDLCLNINLYTCPLPAGVVIDGPCGCDVLHTDAYGFEECYLFVVLSCWLIAGCQFSNLHPGIRAGNAARFERLNEVASFGKGCFSLIDDDSCVGERIWPNLTHGGRESANGVDVRA